MDPLTFGMVAIGVAGGSLFVISVLENYGIKVNKTMVSIVLEFIKAGGLLYLLKHISQLFL